MPRLKPTPIFVNINGKYIRIGEDNLPQLKNLDKTDRGFLYVTKRGKIYMLKAGKTTGRMIWRERMRRGTIKTMRMSSVKSMIPPKIDNEGSSQDELENFRHELQELLKNKEVNGGQPSVNIPLIDLNF